MSWRALLAAALAVQLAGCADHIGTTYGEADRDLSTPALRAALRRQGAVPADSFPLGAPAEGRRCGGPLGRTQADGLPRREPLRSSIAWATDGLLGNPFRPGQTYERQLRAASIRHDLCYGHGLATYGRTRRDCDFWIRADAARLCTAVEGAETRARCTLRGDIPYFAVAPLGWTFYHDNLQPTCEYDPGINPPRDFVLGGRFVAQDGVLPGQVLHVAPEGRALRLRVTGFAAGPVPRPVLLRDMVLPLDAVPIAENRDGPPPEGRCLRAPCHLAGVGLEPRDFLTLAPKVLDLDGDELDEVAFMAVDGLRQPVGPAHGMVAFALGLARPPEPGRGWVTAGFVRTSEEEAAAQPDGRLSRAAVRQQLDVLGQTWLTGRFLPDPGRQLLLVSLRVERDAGERRLGDAQERGFAEFRLVDFPRAAGTAQPGPPRLRRTLFRHDGVYFTSGSDPGRLAGLRPEDARLTELYRRFQNPPMPWRRADGRSGVLLLARDWLDAEDTRAFRIPAGVWDPGSQDRGVRVIAYGPPAAPSAVPVPDTSLTTGGRRPHPTGCGDLASWDPDWQGCRADAKERTVQAGFVWNWTRDVNPVLELPDGSGRFAAVALDAGPARDGQPLREALVFYLTPPLRPERLDGDRVPSAERMVAAFPVVPPADPAGDNAEGTAAGRWLAYPALAARLGQHGEGGLALFRTAPAQGGSGGAVLQIASAVPGPGREPAWTLRWAECALPHALDAAGAADARPGVEGGDFAHLRLSPVLRLPGAGHRDGFAIATRARRPDGLIASDALALVALAPVDDQGWNVGGHPCRSLASR